MFEWLKRMFKRRRSVESVDESVEETVESVETKPTLAEWMKRMEELREHPLTQAKIVNYDILLSLTNVLRSMDRKLDKLELLDEILGMLKEVRDELSVKGVRSKKLERAIEMVELSLKERRILELLEREMSADEVAEQLGVSRSTASYHLNRLAKKGLVEKVVRGKRVIFRKHVA